MGVALVWRYAAIRPRFGAGPRTAAIAGLYFWSPGSLVWTSFFVLGIFPWGMFPLGAASWLIVVPAAALSGASPYSEAS